MEKSKTAFNNKQSASVYKKAVRSKAKYAKKFGDDTGVNYSARVVDNEYIGDILGVKNIAIGDAPEGTSEGFDREKGIIVGNIRMGFGHYRISMAIASAANSMGYTPYWMDLNSYKQTTCTKVISAQNDLYSKGSRISQKSKLFNKAVWEPLNYEGFRKLSYNSADQKNAELMAPVYKNVPKDIPVVATHVWPAQAAIHAGMKNVVNAIPDNWPMALHFAEGSIHTVQTHYAYQGYRILNGMAGDQVLNPMPEDSLKYVGHYVDHELVANIEEDCRRRIARKESGKPMRFLLTIGGAGAQKEIFAAIINELMPDVKNKNKAYILPTDVRGTAPQHGIALDDFYAKIGQTGFMQTSIFLDASCLPELLRGSNRLMAFGATSVEVIMKKISNRNTKSDMDAELNCTFCLFCSCIFILI